MKLPRFRIAWVMFAIATFAIDLTVMLARLDYPSPLGEELLFGALPMANVLAVGLLIAHHRPWSRPFLLGFELFGAIALAAYIALARLFPDSGGPIRWYVSIVIEPIVATMGRPRSLSEMLIVWFVVFVMLATPQLAFALVGGYLSRRYKVRIAVTRR